MKYLIFISLLLFACNKNFFVKVDQVTGGIILEGEQERFPESGDQKGAVLKMTAIPPNQIDETMTLVRTLTSEQNKEWKWTFIQNFPTEFKSCDALFEMNAPKWKGDTFGSRSDAAKGEHSFVIIDSITGIIYECNVSSAKP